jgi:CRISPR type I-E-associated protein CasB/Cse2
MDIKKSSRIDNFLGWLQDHADNRGIMADLRRGFSEATAHRAWPYLTPWCNLKDERDRFIWQTIAGGFATLESSEEFGNIGTTLRRLAIGERRQKTEVNEALKSFDGRFRRLLTCHTAQEVCGHLPGIIRAAKQKGVGVNLRQLFWDLVRWNGEKRDVVRVKWAAEYWGTPEEEGSETEWTT